MGRKNLINITHDGHRYHVNAGWGALKLERHSANDFHPRMMLLSSAFICQPVIKRCDVYAAVFRSGSHALSGSGDSMILDEKRPCRFLSGCSPACLSTSVVDAPLAGSLGVYLSLRGLPG